MTCGRLTSATSSTSPLPALPYPTPHLSSNNIERGLWAPKGSRGAPNYIALLPLHDTPIHHHQPLSLARSPVKACDDEIVGAVLSTQTGNGEVHIAFARTRLRLYSEDAEGGEGRNNTAGKTAGKTGSVEVALSKRPLFTSDDSHGQRRTVPHVQYQLPKYPLIYTSPKSWDSFRDD